MKNRKNLSFLLGGALLLSSACSVQENTQTTETALPPQTTVISAETAAPEASVNAEETRTESTSAPEKTEAEEEAVYTDENGLLTETAVKRCQEIMNSNYIDTSGMYGGFFDFDLDEVPEFYIVFHNSGQGGMPVKVFRINGDELGQFYGYSRDGFTRFSYGEDCVYIHSKEEHSMHRRNDTVSKITVENGSLVTEQILCANGTAGNRFPLIEMTYRINETLVDAESWYKAYSDWLFYEPEIYPLNPLTREANEVSLCAYDVDKDSDVRAAVDIYNAYISGQNAAEELFGSKPIVFAFDDYDRNGSYEAFVQPYTASPTYFWNGRDFEEIASEQYGYDFTRKGVLFYSQPYMNGSCDIYGVRDGKFYEHENSDCVMLIRPSEYYLPCDVNTNFILFLSAHDNIYQSGSNYGAHTHKPYFFEYSCNEIVGVPVTEADFADRPDILEELDKLKAILAENEGKAGEITEMFLRGERYLNVNYIEPIETQSEDGTVNYIVARSRYKTYLIQNQVTLIDEGEGRYTASAKG